jgi:hypothetical protein
MNIPADGNVPPVNAMRIFDRDHSTVLFGIKKELAA